MLALAVVFMAISVVGMIWLSFSSRRDLKRARAMLEDIRAAEARLQGAVGNCEQVMADGSEQLEVIKEHQAAQIFLQRLMAGDVIVTSERGHMGYLELVAGDDDNLRLWFRPLGQARSPLN